MIDIESENCFLLSKAREHVSFSLSPATAWRWALRGILPRHSRSSEPIKLETLLIGGRRYTSSEAITRFLARLSEPENVVASPSKLRAQQIARASEQAAATF